MRDVSELAVMERRLFEMDVIPFRALITASNLSVFTSQFLFKGIELGEDEKNNVTAIKMQTGEFKIEDKVYPIEALIIERRSITFKIYATSSVAETFYNSIAEKISNADTSNFFHKDKHLIKTMETSCVVTLDFNHKDIFAKRLNVFLNKRAKEICSSAIGDVGKVTISPRSITFIVDYTVTDENLLNNKINITSKALTIEPRVGISLGEKRFYTVSPTDSDTHLKLLKEVEKLFDGTK
ncbi:MAG: hypothetical protein Q8K51_06445 [Nitrospirota bacterium]|nr:hypothetical protein [Nitrospirota bacterium]